MSAAEKKPTVHGIFDPATWTVTYVVYDAPGSACAIIDSVLDYDPKSGRTKHTSADKVVEFVRANGLKVEWILETHAHADHLSAAPFVREQVGGKIAIGEKISAVQEIFKNVFNLEKQFLVDGSQFDKLFAEGETFNIGDIDAEVIYTPGHTPADMSWRIGDAVFVGDTLFMPDVGTARCDFPGGNAHTLYHSIQTLLSMPEDTRLFMCHDYPGDKREHAYLTTVAEQKKNNIHVHDGVTEQQFVAMREARDKTLEMPRLILPSIQLNIRAGQMPPAEDNGTVYFKIPVNVL